MNRKNRRKLVLLAVLAFLVLTACSCGGLTFGFSYDDGSATSTPEYDPAVMTPTRDPNLIAIQYGLFEEDGALWINVVSDQSGVLIVKVDGSTALTVLTSERCWDFEGDFYNVEDPQDCDYRLWTTANTTIDAVVPVGYYATDVGITLAPGWYAETNTRWKAGTATPAPTPTGQTGVQSQWGIFDVAGGFGLNAVTTGGWMDEAIFLLDGVATQPSQEHCEDFDAPFFGASDPQRCDFIFYVNPLPTTVVVQLPTGDFFAPNGHDNSVHYLTTDLGHWSK